MKLTVTHIFVAAAVLSGAVVGAVVLCVVLIYMSLRTASVPVTSVPATPDIGKPESIDADELQLSEQLKAVIDRATRLAEAIDNNGQFTSVTPAEFAVGVTGQIPDKTNGRIVQIVSDVGMLVQFRGQLVAVRGVDTTGLIDDTAWPLSGRVIEIPQTIRYTTTSGSSRQVFLVDVMPDEMVALARDIASNRMPASNQEKKHVPQQSAN